MRGYQNVSIVIYKQVFPKYHRMSVGGHSQQKHSMKKWRSSFIYFETDSQAGVVNITFITILQKISRIVKNSYEYLLFAHVIVILATDS